MAPTEGGGRRDTILDVATRLFAAMGYDGTSTRQIADAAGLNIATVSYHVGSKRELYLAVMELAHRRERTALEPVVQRISTAGPEDTAAAIHTLIDTYLDFYVANPEVAALWLHRWLSDASDVTELERAYVRPLVKLVGNAFTPAIKAGYIDKDIDLDFVLWTVVWCVRGFGKGGVLSREGERTGPSDAKALRRFRAHLHRMIHRNLGLPGEP